MSGRIHNMRKEDCKNDRKNEFKKEFIIQEMEKGRAVARRKEKEWNI